MPVKETDSRLKRYSTFANMRYCFRCTREYLPALLRWCAASVLLAVLSPLVGILLPRAALAALEGDGTVWTPVGATLVFSVLLALCMGGAKLCEKYLYQYKLLMGSYYMGRISEKGLRTDYQNQEDELFCTLQQESFRACNQNESELRNVYYMWTGFLSGLLGLFVYAVILGRLGIWLLPLLAGSGALGYWIAGRESAFVARNAGERAKYNRELGYVDAAADEPDRVRVQSCLALAGLWERVRALPEGMDTPLDPSIREGGVRLSGGETQKLMLARAIYKDAPVLVLDEPTAALDPISESELYRVYHEIARDKTSLFISHRLASTRFCNRILLVENGAVLEEGTHEQLLTRGGRYSELYRTQAEYYREHPGEEEKR